MLRLSLAVLLAAPISCLVVALFFVPGSHPSIRSASFPWDMIWDYVRPGVFYGIPLTLLVGLPFHASLMRRGLTRLRDYLISGIIVFLPIMALGTFVTAIFSGTEFLNFVRGTSFIVASLLVAGGLTSAVFWFIRRPDRDHALTPCTNTPT